MIVTAFIELCYAHGDKALQAGRWPYLSQRLDELEAEYPGIRAAVIAGVQALGAA